MLLPPRRQSPRAANLKGLPAVGATLVVARFAHRVWRQGDHKGRPYIIYLSPFTLLQPPSNRLTQATSAEPQSLAQSPPPTVEPIRAAPESSCWPRHRAAARRFRGPAAVRVRPRG